MDFYSNFVKKMLTKCVCLGVVIKRVHLPTLRFSQAGTKTFQREKNCKILQKNVYACPFIQIKVKQWTFHEIVAPLSGKMPDL